MHIEGALNTRGSSKYPWWADQVPGRGASGATAGWIMGYLGIPPKEQTPLKPQWPQHNKGCVVSCPGAAVSLHIVAVVSGLWERCSGSENLHQAWPACTSLTFTFQGLRQVTAQSQGGESWTAQWSPALRTSLRPLPLGVHPHLHALVSHTHRASLCPHQVVDVTESDFFLGARALGEQPPWMEVLKPSHRDGPGARASDLSQPVKHLPCRAFRAPLPQPAPGPQPHKRTGQNPWLRLPRVPVTQKPRHNNYYCYFRPLRLGVSYYAAMGN